MNSISDRNPRVGSVTGVVADGLIMGQMCVERRGAPGRPAGPCGGSRWAGWAAPWAV
jgi:hypothetical protein